MKDENIKEILEQLKIRNDLYNDRDESCIVPIEYYEAHILSDYITSLEQQVQDLKADYGSKSQVERDLLEQENERLKSKIKYLKRAKDIMYQYLQLIADIGYDYDGFNSVESLKGLIDEMVKYALWGRDEYDTEVIYVNNGKEYNILNEELKGGNNE